MNGAKLARVRQRLMAEESYLLREIEVQVAELEDSAESAGEERVSAPDDASAELFEHEKSLAVEGAFEEMLAEVRHAVHKLDAGTYGVCDSCGQAIDIHRLEARPQATLCVSCKAREEHEHSSHVLGHSR